VEQKRVQAELEGLQRTLEAKEAQMARMMGGRGQIAAMKQHYDRILADLQSERDDLARERSELVQVPPLAWRLRVSGPSGFPSPLGLSHTHANPEASGCGL
jgi:hypothetical protein